jgi:MinD superfamily P-loop ATPase
VKIAIASGKGGTGKTTLSINLATMISETHQVVLTDLDVEEPNSGLFFSGRLVHQEDKFKMIPKWVEDKCSLCGDCQNNCNFHAVLQLGPMIMVFPELCHSCYACSELCPEEALPMVPYKMGELRHFRNGNLSFIESRLIIGEEQAVPLIAQTNKYIDDHFKEEVFKIYDAPPGTSCPVIEATKNANFVILVTEPTPFGLHDLKLAVETMKELDKDYGVVVNRYGTGNDEVLAYCGEENIPVIAKIPNSRAIAGLYSKGRLIYPEIPEFREQLEKVRQYIFDIKRGVPV